MTAEPLRPRSPRRPEDDAVFQARRRERRLRQEITTRASVALLIFAFNEGLGLTSSLGANPVIRVTALVGILVNAPYYLAAYNRRAPRAQAYARMLGDIWLITVSLYAAGGLAAAAYIGVYTPVPVYAGIVLSSAACVVATGTATVSFVAVGVLQQAGWLPRTEAIPPTAWVTATFNLLVLNIVGALTAVLARAYRLSRRRLAALHRELERAHDESLRLNTELQQTARLSVLGEVLTGVSHEIRNALQAVILPLDVIRRKVRDAPSELHRHLDRAEQGAQAAMRIITNVLQTARQSSAGKVPVSWAEIARRTVELKGYDLRRDRITVELDFPHDFPLVVARPLQLQQVLLNLVTNAQDALRDGTRARAIAIVGLTEPGRAVLEVRDTGPGILPEALPRVFEPFFTTKPHGTGLGLAISTDIVHQLGGELTAGNRPDGGAVFRVSLPALPLAPAATGASTA